LQSSSLAILGLPLCRAKTLRGVWPAALPLALVLIRLVYLFMVEPGAGEEAVDKAGSALHPPERCYYVCACRYLAGADQQASPAGAIAAAERHNRTIAASYRATVTRVAMNPDPRSS